MECVLVFVDGVCVGVVDVWFGVWPSPSYCPDPIICALLNPRSTVLY